LGFTVGIALDTNNNRLLAIAEPEDQASLNDILAIDLVTGARTVVSSNDAGDTKYDSPRAVAYDSVEDRVLIADSNLNAVLAIDPSSGERVILSK